MTAAGMWPGPFPCEYCSPSLYSSPLSSLLPLLILVFCLPVGIGRGDRHLTQLGLPAQALLSLPHRPCEQWGATTHRGLAAAPRRPQARNRGAWASFPVPSAKELLEAGSGSWPGAPPDWQVGRGHSSCRCWKIPASHRLRMPAVQRTPHPDWPQS